MELMAYDFILFLMNCLVTWTI